MEVERRPDREENRGREAIAVLRQFRVENCQSLLLDAIRLEQFTTAVAQVVQPGDRVADVGCGSAVLGLLCLQAGAGHVDAIDSTAAIEIARQSLTRAGWGEQANFIHGKSFQVDLPEPVDVVICDHVGYFGFDYGLVETMADARHRFLKKPGGRLIPGRLQLQLGAVESDKCRQLAEGWQAPLYWKRRDDTWHQMTRFLRSGGYLWNSGMFVFSARALLEEMGRQAPAVLAACRAALDGAERRNGLILLDEAAFAAAPSISIDYAVMEKTQKAAVVGLDAGWSDVGDWAALWDLADHDADGNAVAGADVLCDESLEALGARAGRDPA